MYRSILLVHHLKSPKTDITSPSNPSHSPLFRRHPEKF
ncbi:hypothetical protein O53_3491 [Microcystis aeruginosa TAIHU98]|uniref:Uncharacterized protein n=1 Tax=Microcystis aeruginosa TAIHU98 TaxID=1134457 RepID=L7E8S5_MICAE|nr:hypothetical protein O53_3491 [Microcystis aeruginosa TAIHU98]